MLILEKEVKRISDIGINIQIDIQVWRFSEMAEMKEQKFKPTYRTLSKLE